MTDGEILKLLLEKVSSIDEKVSSLDEKVSSIDERVSSLDEKVSSIDERVSSIESDVTKLKFQLIKSTAELKAMDEMILDEVERVHTILDKHKEDKSVHTA